MMQTREAEGDWVAAWRSTEDDFFRAVMADPQLYMDAIRFVRAVADDLADCRDLEELVSRFESGGAEDLVPIARALESPRLILLDHSLARGAAFHLRAQQLRSEHFAREASDRLLAARRRGEPWATLAQTERHQNGHVFYDRLEVSTETGEGWHVSHGIDVEAGFLYSLSPVRVNPETGEMTPTEPGSRLELASEAELLAELERRKSAAGAGCPAEVAS